ncbi:MAG: phytanoyl-CoA dioxygenase family protein [Gammaproteobacteria bacterium]|nr:phytanoyl-CoA dioxygenase family protein [Gammaproteobacteria bacterium]
MMTLAQELATLRVSGSSKVGWDEHLPPNEHVDETGNFVTGDPNYGEPDPRAPSQRVSNHPEVLALRQHLRENNGIRGLEICEPSEVQRAATIFHRDGFVVVKDALSPEHLAAMREACERNLRTILSKPHDNDRKYLQETGRLPHRYCYGTCSASRQMMHEPAWAGIIDMPTTTPILCEIFGSSDYSVWGGGGDLSLPGAIEYQHLHTDGLDEQQDGEARLKRVLILNRLNLDASKEFEALDFKSQRRVMDFANTGVTINFTLTDLTWENGPIRQIPGTHTNLSPPPSIYDEPEWMRLSTLVGAPAGSAIFRDTRCWHGATPNLSNEIRALPSVEYSANTRPGKHFQRTMPHEIWQKLSPHAQEICRNIKADEGVWPFGAGELHPLSSMRMKAYLAMSGEEGTVESVRTDPSSAGTVVRLFNARSDSPRGY